MAQTLPGFLKYDGDSIIYNDNGELLFYVPEVYFERKIAVIMGTQISLIGLLNYRLVNANGKEGKLNLFDFPTVFITEPSRSEKIKDYKIIPKSQPDNYRVLHYKKGDKIIVNKRVPQITQTVEDFLHMWMSGKLPTTIPHNEIQDFFIENMTLNGGKYKLNMQMFGILFSETSRSSSDKKVLFRHTDMKDMQDYQNISMADIPNYVSPATALMSQNINDSLVHGIINKDHMYSPLEKLMM